MFGIDAHEAADDATTAATRNELQRLVQGFQVSQAIHAAVVLELPDLLSGGPRNVSDLALATGTDPEALYRMMRALAMFGVMKECGAREFELTAIGAGLRTDAPRSLAPIVRLQCRSSHWQAWGNLIHALGNGQTAFEYVHGKDVWTYRAQHREEGDAFDNAMAAFAHQIADAFLKVCDVGRARHIVDVGGGDGTFLARILEANPHMQGTIFDRPHVIERACTFVASAGLSNRCKCSAGDFFAAVPGGGDLYLLKWILHDWDDAAAMQILRSCRQAMPVGCRLLVVEHLVGSPHTSQFAVLRDLQMRVVTGGRERTSDEFAVLLSNTGFLLRSVLETAAGVSVIEASAV